MVMTALFGQIDTVDGDLIYHHTLNFVISADVRLRPPVVSQQLEPSGNFGQ